jgi:hypothetical protein
MKQQTAVEWLSERLIRMIPTINPIYKKDIDTYLQQAKEMEKEQIKEAYNHGWDDREYEVEDSWKKDADEKYFNETYGQ